MKNQKISDVDAFVKETEEARKLPLTQEDIDRINEIAKRAEIEELENSKAQSTH